MTAEESNVVVMHSNIASNCQSMIQAEGRCKFFKWQDELLNGQTPAQQPALMSGSQAAHQSTSNLQTAPSGVAGGSGVFADGGMAPRTEESHCSS